MEYYAKLIKIKDTIYLVSQALLRITTYFTLPTLCEASHKVGKSLEAHHERQKEKYRSNPDIDVKKKEQNYHLIKPQQSYYQEIQSRIEKAGCRVRKDSIKFVDTIITASPEFFSPDKPNKTKAYFKRAVDFLIREVGKDNIFTATVHMDERTPHMHLCFVPLTEDNRLCAKEIIGNRPKLVEWQDKFHEYMSEAFPRLERGEPAIETQRKHIPVQLFKQATRLTAEMEGIQNLMNSVNILNVGRTREQLLLELAKWLPKVKSFDKWITSVEQSNNALKSDVSVLQNENEALKSKDWNNRMSTAKISADFHNLKNEHKKLKDFLNTLPDDLRSELLERYKHLKDVGRDLGMSR